MSNPTHFAELFRLPNNGAFVAPEPTPEELEAAAAKEARRQKHEQEQAEIRANNRARRCDIPPRYRWAIDHADAVGALKANRQKFDAAVALEGATNTVLVGGTGRGKTSLASLLLHKRALARLPGQFVSAYELEVERRQTPLGQGDGPLAQAAFGMELLLLDDVGAEPPTFSPVGNILFRRYDHNLPTIITTGFGEAWLVERYGAAVVRRMFEGALVIDLGGKP